MARAIKKRSLKKDTKWVEFVSAPIYQLSKRDCMKGQLQNVLKKYSSQIVKHPFIVLRAFKKKKLKMAKGYKQVDLKILKKTCYSMKDKLTALINLKGHSKKKFDEYKEKAKAEETITRQDLIEAALGEEFEFEYAENIEDPEKLIDMKSLQIGRAHV